MATNITTKTQSLPADLVSKLISGIAESRASTVVAGGGKPLLRLLKSGDWVFGPSNEEVQEGSQWVINTTSLAHGFSCWVDGVGNAKNELRGEVMVSVAEHLPPRPAPIDGFAFKEQRSFEAKCLTGDDEGTEVLYKTPSVGGMREMDALLALIHKKLASPGGANFPCPVIELKSSSYTHKKWGQIFNPIFELVGWASMSGELEGEEVTSARKAPVAPAKKAPVKSAGPAPTQRAHETGQRRRPAAR